MPGAMIHEEVDGSVGLPPATNNSIVDPTELHGSGGAWPGTNNSFDLIRQEFDRRMGLLPRLGRPRVVINNSIVLINNSIVLSQSNIIQQYRELVGTSLGLNRALLSPSNIIQQYRELVGTGPVVTNNSIDLTLQEHERSLGLWPSPGLGRPRVVINNSIVLSQSDLREPLGFHGDPLATSNGIALRQSYPNQLYERQPNRGISWMMRDGNGITGEAVDLEAGLINGENRRMTESSQEHNLFDSNQLPKVILGVTCQAVFSLLGALDLINTQFSLEFKILAIVLAFGFISSLVSMLIPKGKLRKSLIKVGAVSVSSAVIVAVAMLLRVDKMWMWIIAGAVSVLPLITVIRS